MKIVTPDSKKKKIELFVCFPICNFIFYFAFENAIFIARKPNTLAINHF